MNSICLQPLGLSAVLACGVALVCSCNRIPEPPPPPPPSIDKQPAALQQPAAPAQPEAAPAPEETTASDGSEKVIKRRQPEPGFNPLSLKDTLPICVFPNQTERVKAPFLKDVKPQKLAPNSKVTFGVFGPHCLNFACDDRPNLQCWTEQEGEDTIVVKTRFFSFHKDGSNCTEDCLDLDTACDTQIELKPGKKYTVRHGDKTYKLQTGLVRDPCFGAK